VIVLTLLAQQVPHASQATTRAPDFTSWNVGMVLGVIVVLAVVALVVPILLLARKIGQQAPLISTALQRSLKNTAGITGLQETIDHATVITAGLYRARKRLGG
jgi:hypothetical protein